jgi:molybdopterin/thiamine biosynthesis adenylyltransferase
VIVSSLELKPGLEKVGFYSPDNNTEKGSFIFSIIEGKLSCSLIQDNGKREEMQIDVINYSTDFHKRNHGIIDESILQERIITIIGLGSGGSAIALDLVRCGVTDLILIDFDNVSISNLCRSIYNLYDIGRKKTEAILEKLLSVNPCVNIQLYDEDVCKMENKNLMKIIEKSDLIIEASDSAKTKILINGLAYSSTPILYPSVYDQGKGGDILFTMPGLPCYECVFNSILDEMKKTKQGEWDYSTNQTKPMPALISDIQVVVARTVKLALAILTGDQEDSFIEKITEPGCSILFIGNEKDTFIFDKPFQEIWAETKIDPECSCQSLR